MNTFFRHVPFAEIAEMESKFREYEDIEQESLYYCLGGNFPEHEIAERKGDYRRREKRLRRFFEDLNGKRLQGILKPPTAQKPTASQKSKQ